jgi:hypothetical protein
MTLLRQHLRYYQDIFNIPGMYRDPFLMLGFQDVYKADMPADFHYDSLKEILQSKGVKEITIVDYFDDRADRKFDLNYPVPGAEHEKYNVVMDIGTLEHVFDTRQCLESCLRMVKVGGLYVLVTPIYGYFKHGLHTFNANALRDALTLNNFEILYEKYSTNKGHEIDDMALRTDILMWIAARKTKSLGTFAIPQQNQWTEVYHPSAPAAPAHPARRWLKNRAVNMLRPFWRFLIWIEYRSKKFLSS